VLYELRDETKRPGSDVRCRTFDVNGEPVFLPLNSSCMYVTNPNTEWISYLHAMDERLQFLRLLERNGDNFVPTANLPDNRLVTGLKKHCLDMRKEFMQNKE